MEIVATGPQGFLEIGVLKFIRIHTRANQKPHPIHGTVLLKVV